MAHDVLVYTCSRSQRRRCEFFLWDDEAKRRSGQALLAGSRSEAGITGDDDVGVRTPSVSRIKDMTQTSGLMTPETGQRKRRRDGEDVVIVGLDESPAKMQRMSGRKVNSSLTGWLKNVKDQDGGEKQKDGEEGLFGWDQDMDGVVADMMLGRDGSKKDAVQTTLSPSKPPPLPPLGRPAEPERPKVHMTPTMGESRSQPALQLPPRLSAMRSPLPPKASVAPPSISQPSAPTNLNPINPPPTPTPMRYTSTPLMNRHQTRSQYQQHSQLINQTLTLLEAHRISLPEETKSDLINLLNTHDLRTLGIMKGRDISRLAIKTRDEKIQELLGRIETLEAEKEAWRAGSLKGNVNSSENIRRKGR